MLVREIDNPFVDRVSQPLGVQAFEPTLLADIVELGQLEEPSLHLPVFSAKSVSRARRDPSATAVSTQPRSSASMPSSTVSSGCCPRASPRRMTRPTYRRPDRALARCCRSPADKPNDAVRPRSRLYRNQLAATTERSQRARAFAPSYALRVRTGREAVAPTPDPPFVP